MLRSLRSLRMTGLEFFNELKGRHTSFRAAARPQARYERSMVERVIKARQGSAIRAAQRFFRLPAKGDQVGGPIRRAALEAFQSVCRAGSRRGPKGLVPSPASPATRIARLRRQERCGRARPPPYESSRATQGSEQAFPEAG